MTEQTIDERLKQLELRIEALELRDKRLGPQPETGPTEEECREQTEAIEALRRKMEGAREPVAYQTGTTTDRNNPGLKKIKPGGQQESYLVLSDEERAKGFVRPVRRTYKHLKCGTTTTMSQDIAETYARNPKFYCGTFCCNCRAHFDLISINESVRTVRDSEGFPRAFAWLGVDGQLDGTYVGE